MNSEDIQDLLRLQRDKIVRRIMSTALLYGNDRWRERKALNDMAESIRHDLDENNLEKSS